MKKGKHVMGWVLLAGLAAGCGGSDDGSGPPPENQTGGAQGTVVVSGAGLAGVTVGATRAGSTSRQATTNASGAWSFTGLETGSWTIGVTPPAGYTLATGEAGTRTVAVTANQTTQVGALQLVQSSQGGPTTNVDMATGNTFSPSTVTIARGASVRWTNRDQVAHNATGNGFGTGNLNPNDTQTVQFNNAGTFSYSCTLHTGMNGTVVVQ